MLSWDSKFPAVILRLNCPVCTVLQDFMFPRQWTAHMAGRKSAIIEYLVLNGSHPNQSACHPSWNMKATISKALELQLTISHCAHDKYSSVHSPCLWRSVLGRRPQRRLVLTEPQSSAVCWCRHPTTSSRSQDVSDTSQRPSPACNRQTIKTSSCINMQTHDSHPVLTITLTFSNLLTSGSMHS